MNANFRPFLKIDELAPAAALDAIDQQRLVEASRATAKMTGGSGRILGFSKLFNPRRE
jgi:predicted transcriptional regulator